MDCRFLKLVSFTNLLITSTVLYYLIGTRHCSTYCKHNNEQIIEGYHSLNLERRNAKLDNR